MADLENMLLEAAGRTSSPVRKRHKVRNSRKKRDGEAFSDGGSDSREEDSDEGAGAASKRPPRCTSHVPLKKRLDINKRSGSHNNEHGSKGGGELEDGGPANEEDGSSEESDIGSDLYKNEGDKHRLAKMTELQREMILSDRASKKGDKELREQLRMKRDNNNANAKATAQSSSAKVRSSARHAERTAAKGDVLSELRAKRMKQQILDTHGKLGNTSGKGSSNKRVKQKSGKTASSSSSSSQSESVIRSDSERESSDDGGLADSDDDKDMHESERPTFQDIKEITIRRSKLVKWLNEPFFEELIVGCFVRMGIGKSDSGPVYRLCMVQRVDGGDPNKHYKVENRVTHKYLVCVWGSENSAKRFQMAVVSDSAPLEKEFKQWLREVDRTCSQLPSKMNVSEKKEAIRRTNTYIYSAATVKQMLEEKKSAPSRPLNIAVEKDRLKRELEIAKSKNDEAEVDRILKRMAELEAIRKARENDAKAIRLAEMNRKNKFENFKNLSEHRQTNANLKAGEEGYDPFSRRWTRSRNYYNSAQGKESKEDEENEGGKGEKDETAGEVSKGQEEEPVTTKVGVEATEAALQAAANAGKLVDTSAPVGHGTESYMLHDFDLPISLIELKNFDGAQGLEDAFLARKQKIEATVGCRVPENDGSRHALTLTISDYKRRRGLL
ncbi:Plus3-like superfamily [Sesbania bispinosa]|nr:Plus3-like superfamily [Sesbania bispinosa]